ncbi:ATP-binding protein [Brytella acorum]|uniref:ATP-binding protein n=1 Tax=Brytella acorum TaxID=2959299 RepID=A0AA35Y268_9PROT|nr:ATP-binding protein [Brytella acorum]MDF3625765.1 ATP-binding protein [Brytella acorum]CAI9121284.1 ATP-binding protein [Brytella acorum]
MDPVKNPYAPGAGTPPPILAGRDEILTKARLALERVKIGRSEKSFIAVGLRGVGKTVIMNHVQTLADDNGYHTAYIEAYDQISLASEITKKLRPILLKLSRKEKFEDLAKKALRGLRSFASALNVSFSGVDFSIKSEEGLADSGDIIADLPDLFVIVGEAAKEQKTAIAIIIDEIQYLSETDMEALIMAIHRCNQRSLPVLLFGAGLPQLRGKMGNAKSYVERLFDFPTVDALNQDEAARAVLEPALNEGVEFQKEALNEILRVTLCYPYFIQEWGHAAWNAAETTSITLEDVKKATPAALDRLDKGFFRVRLDRMTPTEKKYIRALAELGPGPHRSGEVAFIYGAEVQSVAPIRSSLIGKGMVYSPAHGDTAFTVPLFDDFMKREMPDWKADEKQ